MYTTQSFKADEFKPARFESTGEITLNGQTFPYHTVCEDNVFYGKDGKPVASIFSYSYFRSDVEDTANRPVLFGFNGGPGSSSMYVHTGFLGTRRLKYGEPDRPTSFGPYEVIDNPNCLLDIADLVLIDPVGTGYGVLIDEDAKKEFYGIEQDAEALLNFCELWLRRYNRTLSPKYLIGESYGCTRAATAAGMAATMSANRVFGVAFDGLVLIGNTVTVGDYFGKNIACEHSIIGFTTYAGVNWFHNHPTDQPVKEWCMEAKEFADTEYLLALHKGARITEEEKEHIIERVTYYTGVSREYLLENGLRIDDATYRVEVLKNQGKSVSRYDGRMTRPRMIPEVVENQEGPYDDATADRYDALFYAALTGDLLPRLNVKLDRNFLPLGMHFKNWDKVCPAGTTGKQLHNAMTRRHGMRTFFANGWFDLCTEFGFVFHTCDHANLPLDRVYIKGYESGHMIYIGEENVKQLCDDIRTFVLGGNPEEN